jgi:uncharacterized protein YhaN
MMRLKSMEAIRYGSLENCSLGEFGERLTVVLGPNESGKSTFTAMTRHVLYGYPRANATEPGYVSASGNRHGRLVFADESGEWAIDRVEGAQRSRAQVVARRGVERPELVESLVAGVTSDSFQVVFGFGLNEMHQIASKSNDSEAVMHHLRAAGAGLAVNPLEVQRSLDARANELFTPGGRTQQLRKLNTEIRDLRNKIVELDAEARDLASESIELQGLLGQLEPLKEEAERLEIDVRLLGNDIGRIQDVQERMTQLESKRAEQAAAVSELERSLEYMDVDDKVIAVAPQLTAVLEDTSGFKTHLQLAEAAQAKADSLRAEIDAIEGLPTGVSDSVQARATVEEWRDRLSDLERKSQAAADASVAARARAQETAATAAELTPRGGSAGRPVLPAIAALAIGVAAVAVGVLTGQWLASGLGVLIAAAGVFLLVRPAAVTEAPLSDEAARAEAEARTAESVSRQASEELAQARLLWRQWLGEQRFDAAGEAPRAVLGLLDQLAERDRKEAEHRRLVDDARRERAAAEEWVIRLVDVVRQYDESAAQIPALTAAVELAAQARQRQDAAQQVLVERREVEREMGSNRMALAATEQELEAMSQAIVEIAERYGVEPAEALPRLQALNTAKDTMRAEKQEQLQELTKRTTEMEVRLDAQSRSDALARSRQQLAGLLDDAQSLADEYIIHKLAAGLTMRTFARYEEERQSDVVKIASRVFSEMTDGRYTDIRMSMFEDNAVKVVRADQEVLDATILSRGAQEQLYLALRVALIASLGDTGRHLPVLMDDVIVNFDPERREGAAKAVAELSSHRQVVFFTCSPGTADLLTSSAPFAKMIEIDRCALKG